MAITIVWSGREEYKNIRADIRFKKIVYALFFIGNFPVFPSLLESSYSCNSLILCCSQEGDPLSTPEGEAACGEHPLAPSFVGVFHQPSDDYCNIGRCPSGGGGSTMCKEPKRATACFSPGFQQSRFPE
jgi:hypothetical protein